MCFVCQVNLKLQSNPPAVPEKSSGAHALFLNFYDPCSLFPPLSAVAGVARHAPRALDSNSFAYKKYSHRKSGRSIFGRGRRT